SFRWASACTCVMWVFFFQAEDGIRDWSVTGVQTCALPISAVGVGDVKCQGDDSDEEHLRGATQAELVALDGRASRHDLRRMRSRSEERRVGKECRSRWSACH